MSRKLKIFIILQLFVTVIFLACISGIADPTLVVFDQWFEFTKWNFGIYVAGNIGEHASKSIKPKPNEPVL